MDEKIQWHSAFCSAIELELRDFKDVLAFEPEKSLSKKPLQIDLFVIKNKSDKTIDNDIARCFKKYNIMEYKSPKDKLSIDTFAKTIAYACLYKSLTGEVNEIKFDELTITMVRHGYPREMFSTLQKEGYSVDRVSPGVYKITGNVMFYSQVIVTKELDPVSFEWLTVLTGGLSKENYSNLLNTAENVKNDVERKLVSSVMAVVDAANEKSISKWRKEGDKMFNAAQRRIYAKELQEAEAKGIFQGEIRGQVKAYHELGQPIETIAVKFHLSAEEVKQILEGK